MKNAILKRLTTHTCYIILFSLISFFLYGNTDHSTRLYKLYETEQDSKSQHKNSIQEPSTFIDSIEQNLARIPVRLERLDSLHQWMLDYMEIDPSKSIELAILGQQKSQKFSNKEWETKFDFEIGKSYLHMAQYEYALDYFDKIINEYRANGDQSILAEGLYQKGFTKVNQGKFEEALQLYFEALKFFEKLEDQQGVGKTFNKISFALDFLSRYEEGAAYGEKALAVFKQLNDTTQILNAYQNIADSYLGEEKYQDALIYIEKSIDLAEAINISPISLGSLINTKGNTLKLLERYDEAIDAYKKSNQICTALNHPGGMSVTLANTSDVYMRKEITKMPYLFRKNPMT